MTVPLWAPFALLAAVCAVLPRPAWTRRVDWVTSGSWATLLAFGVGFWIVVVLAVLWTVS